MSNSKIVAAVLACVLLSYGCTSEAPSTPATTASTDDTVNEGATPDPSATASSESSPIETATVEVPPFETAPPIEEVELDSAQAYIDRMQQLVDNSLGPNQRPSLEGVDAAIVVGDEGRAKFPEDENLLRVSTVLRYQSLPLDADTARQTERRLELGQLARLLIERNQDNLSSLGNMPSILMIEESKAYIAQQDLTQAWNSLAEAHANGFNQAGLLFLDPTFAPVLEDETALAEIKSWIHEDVENQISAAESFPFDFTLQSLTADGVEVSLSDFKGKAVIVDIWGTWCPPCRAALPHLIELHENHKDQLAVVGINFEEQAGATTFEEAQSQLAEFMKSDPLPYPCLYGQREVLTQIPGFSGFPTMVFLDKSGAVRLSLTGYQPQPMLEAVVANLIAE